MAAKKRKKKKATAKTTKRSANPLSCVLEVKKVIKVETGNVYLVCCKGTGKGRVELGHVTASSDSAARTKAKNYLKRLL